MERKVCTFCELGTQNELGYVYNIIIVVDDIKLDSMKTIAVIKIVVIVVIGFWVIVGLTKCFYPSIWNYIMDNCISRIYYRYFPKPKKEKHTLQRPYSVEHKLAIDEYESGTTRLHMHASNHRSAPALPNKSIDSNSTSIFESTLNESIKKEEETFNI